MPPSPHRQAALGYRWKPTATCARNQASLASASTGNGYGSGAFVRRVRAQEAVSMFSHLVRVVLSIVVVTGSTAVALSRDVVPFSGGVAPGTIIVKTAERRLYL